MIKKSAYRPVGFRVPQNYVDKIEPKGVDFSSPQMEANKDRGVYSINYRYNGKKGEKRWGYQKVGYVPEGTDHNPIFGMWSFIGGITNTKRTIAIAGKNFYEATYDGRWHFEKYADLSFSETPVGITKESAVVVGNSLYVLTGMALMLIREDAENNGNIKIEWLSMSDYTYIPTTTTHIPPVNAATAPEKGAGAYESPNAFTPARKNTFVGDVELADGEKFAYYQLDGEKSTAWGSSVKLVVNGITAVPKDYPTTETDQQGSYTENNIGGYTIDGFDNLAEVQSFKQVLSDNETRKYFFVNESDTHTVENTSNNYYVYKDGDKYYIGKTNTLYRLVGYTYRQQGTTGYLINGKDYLVMVAKYQNELQGSDNIVLQYLVDGWNPLDNPINKCRYFARFGHNNKLNTLFAYGNPEHPNYLYNSVRPEQAYEIDGEVHNADEDFTYWPTDAYRKLGEANSKIVGAEVVSESKMMVLKTKGGNSPTMYFISPIVVAKDMDGDSETTDDSYTIAEYSTFQSNTTTAGIVPNPDGICNLNGDILFFSNEKQVAGLDIEGITGDSRRAANTRSAYIDRELGKLDPASVKLFAFGNYLILDSDTQTYCCHLSQYSADTRQYEWWAIDNINATFFYEDDDGNAFYTDDKGGIYLLANSTIDETGRSKKVDIDRYFINSATGDLGLITTSMFAAFVVPEAIRNKVCGEEGWKIRFDEDFPVYARVWATDVTNGSVFTRASVGPSEFVWFYLNTEYLHLQKYFLDGQRVLLVTESGSYANAIVHYEGEGGTGRLISFEIIDEDSDFDVASDSFLQNGCVYIPLTWVESDGVENKGFYEFEIEPFQVVGGFRIKNPDITMYISSAISHFNGEFSKETPIQSMWISRPVPLAKFTYDKTIKQVDVYNDTQEPAELYIGCITNKQLHTYQYARIEAFDLGNIDFENTTFDQNRVPVIYHMRRFPRKHQYFSLVQMSTGTDNSLLSDMDITYTLQGVARNKK